ncbi:MAG TPA: hypothetical protein VIJ23_16320 [Mycobacterium sp.]
MFMTWLVGDGEYAAWVNAAGGVRRGGGPFGGGARLLAGRFGVPVRQARRYVHDAGHGRVEIPDRAWRSW